MAQIGFHLAYTKGHMWPISTTHQDLKVNPFLTSEGARPHLLTDIIILERQEGVVLACG